MKINKIQSCYTKNKPSFNYTILDLDGQHVATGHLLSARLKLSIVRMIKTLINPVTGLAEPKIDSYIDFSALWIIKSIDTWIIDAPVTKLTIDYLEPLFTAWLIDQIKTKNEQSIEAVELNLKN